MSELKFSSDILSIRPRSLEEMQRLHDKETDPEMIKAYDDMLRLMKALPDREEWGCDWAIELPDGTEIGGIGCKGLADENGFVEIGYGIDEEYQRHGYATEAVRLMVKWLFSEPDVLKAGAQTEADNFISQKVLLKNGFSREGMGDEGPMFTLDRE